MEINKNEDMMSNTLYGINNEVYTIESREASQINVKYYRKLYITYNLGHNQETRIKEEHLSFLENDIGIKLFFKDGDCYKTIDELYKDNDYSKYHENLQNRVKMNEEKEQKRLKYIESWRPNTKKITSKDIDLILSSYSDEEKNMKEEKDFYDYSQRHNFSYFARMDLNTEYEHENHYEKFYIGKDAKPIEIEDGTTLIDWRSPLGDFFYNAETNELMRDKYFYKVLLKRKFGFFPFRYWNSYIANNDFYKEGVTDEFLMQILLEKRNSNKLTDIIYSIQSNQNKIIRAKSNENFIVQGCAGSGKTMILLHRLSYLKYNNLLPKYDKIKIIAPSKIFKDFVGELSRDLDISEIEQISISNYYLSLINEYNSRYNMIQILNAKFGDRFNENNIFETNVKERKEKLKAIIDSLKDTIRRKQSRYRESINEGKIINEDELDSNIIKIFYSSEYLNGLKTEYNRRIKEIKEEISDIFSYSENISNYQYFELFIVKSIVRIDNLMVEKAKLKNQFLGNIKRKIEEIDAKIKEIERLQDKVINNFYFTYDFFNIIIEDMQLNNPTLIRGKLMRCQLLLLLYINYLHFGEMTNSDRLLCFDEAQDYNENEYKTLKLVNKNVIFNLYGDINQSIFSKGIKNWDSLKKVTNFNFYSLNENYRNTKQITDFCNEKFKYNNISMGIIGKNVEFIDRKQINNIIIKKMNDKKKIVVIVHNMEDLENIIPIDSEYTFYNTISQVKGIEFDSAIVFDDDMTENEKYIAYTRALNELYIVNKNV